MTNDSWTIGLITDGNNSDRVFKIIDSVYNQYIPDDKYEIIIVGGQDPRLKNVIHIPFDESLKPHPHITKKKMDIVRAAKFQNIALLHDYVVLDYNWYDNFVHFEHEDWDMCVCRIEDVQGRRFRDWVLWNTSLPFSSGGIPHAKTVTWVDYNDYSQIKNQYISGTAFCAKKNFLLCYPFNEELCWGESEDVQHSTAVRMRWNLRCNHRSIFKLIKDKGEGWPPRIEEYNFKQNGGI